MFCHHSNRGREDGISGYMLDRHANGTGSNPAGVPKVESALAYLLEGSRIQMRSSVQLQSKTQA